MGWCGRELGVTNCGPDDAAVLLDNLYGRYGTCKYCGGSYTFNRDHTLRKHGHCPKDNAECVALYDWRHKSFYLRLDSLAEVAILAN